MAAHASWLAPTVVLLVLGTTAPGGLLPRPVLPASAVIPVTTAAAAIGLVLGTFAALASKWHEDALLERRHALLGLGLSAVLLVMIGVASVAGAVSGREATDELERATRTALRDSPSWNGGGRVDGAFVSASEVDDGTELAKLLLRPFGVRYRLLLVSVDNAVNPRDVTVDLEHVTLHASNREIHPVPRAELALSTSIDRPDEALPRALSVRAGEHTDGARVFLPSATSFHDVLSITLRVDGSEHTLRGRYFTLAEKRAIDAKRAAAPH
jgi:hypothetical protein